MPEQRKVTGRDAYLIVEVLTFSVEALGRLPIEYRPDNIADMMRLIDEFVKQDATLAQAQTIAQRRLAILLAQR